MEYFLYPGNTDKSRARPVPEWVRKLDIVMRQTHRAGEKMIVGFAGDTVPMVDSSLGEIEHAYLCCSLGSEQLHVCRGYDDGEFEIMGGLDL